MLAVLFADETLLHCAQADESRKVLTHWGVPFAARGTRECAEICEQIPAGYIWSVCDTVDAALHARKDGNLVVFIGRSEDFKAREHDLVLSSFDDLIAALSPHYTRTALRLRDVIASEFESL
ncbi:MAG: hypothetical protein ABR584_01170 [Candidatus Baltobacteraceae bacterium]